MVGRKRYSTGAPAALRATAPLPVDRAVLCSSASILEVLFRVRTPLLTPVSALGYVCVGVCVCTLSQLGLGLDQGQAVPLGY